MQLQKNAVEIIALSDTNISDIVQNVTLYESIDGYLQGSLSIIDGTNFYDNIFGEYDRMIPIMINYEYGQEIITNYFAVDGISNMRITKSEKEYTVHLITAAEHSLKMEVLNEVYNGTSDKIIGDIWKQCMGQGSALIIHKKAISNGKYVVPNIPAIDAITHIINAAVDIDNTGFYIFQRLNDTGKTHMCSLSSMARDRFKDSKGEPFEISNKIASLETISDTDVDKVGTSNQFMIEQYKMNHTNKLADGFWGNNINHVHLNKTKVEKFETIEQTANPITKYKISDKLYDNIVKSGPAGQSYNQQSLFANIYNPADVLSVNIKRRMNENQLKVDDIAPIPYIGCGKAIKVAIGSSNVTQSKADGDYIIADINHTFMREAEFFDYTQSMTLIREFA